MTLRCVDTRYGSQLYFDTDVYFAPLLERYGEYSEGEVAFWRQLLREGATVVDAGANVGCHSLALSKIVGPSGKVFAFEPQQPVFYALCGSLALNEAWNVHAFPYALGWKAHMAAMQDVDYAQRNSFGGISLEDHGDRRVTVLPLDSLGIDRLALLKVDVEGSECEVLLGARETIGRCRPVLYVENDREQNSERLIGVMQDLGYRLYLHAPLLYNPQNWRQDPENLFPNVAAIMLVGFPNEIEIETNLPPIVLPTDMPRLGKHVLP